MPPHPSTSAGLINNKILMSEETKTYVIKFDIHHDGATYHTGEEHEFSDATVAVLPVGSVELVTK